MKPEPLIITIMMDEKAQRYFTDLRNLHFPKHCNYLEAHITLFHKLPSNKQKIAAVLEETARRPVMDLTVAAVKNLGTGVAFEIKSAELIQLRKTLQQKFSPWLSAQDRNRLWPHITVQNKVTAYKASQTLLLLQKDFTPFEIKGTGIATWLYKDGPWEKLTDYLFHEK